MADPSPRCRARWGMTVRAPPHRHRVLTYPSPARPGRRVITVCVPWLSPPRPCRPACAGCARGSCPASLPIPASLIYPLSHQDTAAHNRAASSHAPTYPQSRSTASSFSRQETGVKSSFPRKRESINRPSQVGRRWSHLPANPLHHLSSASCHPSTALPAVLLHRVYGPPPPTPLPRTPPPRHCGESRNPGPYVAPSRCTPFPFPSGKGSQCGDRTLLPPRETIVTATGSPFPTREGARG